jgi:hypothetical protein
MSRCGCRPFIPSFIHLQSINSFVLPLVNEGEGEEEANGIFVVANLLMAHKIVGDEQHIPVWQKAMKESEGIGGKRMWRIGRAWMGWIYASKGIKAQLGLCNEGWGCTTFCGCGLGQCPLPQSSRHCPVSIPQFCSF